MLNSSNSQIDSTKQFWRLLGKKESKQFSSTHSSFKKDQKFNPRNSSSSQNKTLSFSNISKEVTQANAKKNEKNNDNLYLKTYQSPRQKYSSTLSNFNLGQRIKKSCLKTVNFHKRNQSQNEAIENQMKDFTKKRQNDHYKQKQLFKKHHQHKQNNVNILQEQLKLVKYKLQRTEKQVTLLKSFMKSQLVAFYEQFKAINCKIRQKYEQKINQLVQIIDYLKNGSVIDIPHDQSSIYEQPQQQHDYQDKQLQQQLKTCFNLSSKLKKLILPSQKDSSQSQIKRYNKWQLPSKMKNNKNSARSSELSSSHFGKLFSTLQQLKQQFSPQKQKPVGNKILKSALHKVNTQKSTFCKTFQMKQKLKIDKQNVMNEDNQNMTYS